MNERYKGHIALAMAYVVFGLNMPIAKDALSSGFITHFDLTLMRMCGGAVLFWAMSMTQPRERVARIDILKLFFASLFGIQINQASFIAGLSMTSPVNAGIITTVGPILTMLLAALFLREPITWLKGLGVATGAAGAILLILGSAHLAAGHAGHLQGDMLCLLSATSFAVYLTLFKPLISRYSPVTVMKWMFLFAALCCTPLGYESIAAIDYAAMPYPVMMEIAFVVLFATFFSYMLVPVGQKLLRPTVVSMYNYVQPLIASVIAVVMGSDTFSWQKALAAALVFGGVWIVNKSKSRAQMEAEKRYR